MVYPVVILLAVCLRPTASSSRTVIQASSQKCLWPSTSNCTTSQVIRSRNVTHACMCSFCNGYRQRNYCGCRAFEARTACAGLPERDCRSATGSSSCQWSTTLQVPGADDILEKARGARDYHTCLPEAKYTDQCELKCSGELETSVSKTLRERIVVHV